MFFDKFFIVCYAPIEESYSCLLVFISKLNSEKEKKFMPMEILSNTQRKKSSIAEITKIKKNFKLGQTVVVMKCIQNHSSTLGVSMQMCRVHCIHNSIQFHRIHLQIPIDIQLKSQCIWQAHMMHILLWHLTIHLIRFAMDMNSVCILYDTYHTHWLI